MENSRSSSGEVYVFTREEVEALYRILEKEWISYHDEVAYQTAKKISDIIHAKLDRRPDTPA